MPGLTICLRFLSYKEVQLKLFWQNVKANCLPAENALEIVDGGQTKLYASYGLGKYS